MSNYYPQSHFLRLPEVMLRTGLKHSTIYSMIKQGQFPKQKKISTRAVGWDSLEIDLWIRNRLNDVDLPK